MLMMLMPLVLVRLVVPLVVLLLVRMRLLVVVREGSAGGPGRIGAVPIGELLPPIGTSAASSAALLLLRGLPASRRRRRTMIGHLLASLSTADGLLNYGGVTEQNPSPLNPLGGRPEHLVAHYRRILPSSSRRQVCLKM